MIRKVGLSFLLLSASLAAADAQSLDGAYRGQLRLIRELEHIPGADRCYATGSQIEFRVTGSIIETTAPSSGQVFSAPLADDGSFRISGQRPAGRPRLSIVIEWKGILKNSRIEGTSSGLGPGRDCYFTFSTRKQSRK